MTTDLAVALIKFALGTFGVGTIFGILITLWLRKDT